MAKRIAWTDKARADVRAIDRETAIDLLHRPARFLATEEDDVKRLTDIDPPELRLRLGDYRVRFYDRG
jgi:mRNA-degrading endonuclease RelE of RelBE toxin-antitoxin system